MRLESLEVMTFPVPFRTVFRHASATRDRAENVIVIARSASGHVGYGEGCPRSYVTGETVDSCATFIRDQAADIIASVNGTDDLRRWIDGHAVLIDRNPAAFCAIELAILDLLGKIAEAPVEDLLGCPRLEGSFAYTAVLGDAPWPVFRWQLNRYRRAGFGDFKIKVSGKPRRDDRKLAPFRGESGHGARVRLDANNLWHEADACIDHLTALSFDFLAVEEPLQPGDLTGFARVAAACGCRIILDESLLRRDQVTALDDSERWIVNLRVSKMGGLIRSLETAKNAAARGIGVIIGAQVGETSILTRTALALAASCRDNLVAMEGAFGTLLLQRDLTAPCLMFGAGGRITPADLAGLGTAGLGLTVDETALKPAGCTTCYRPATASS